MQVTARKPAFKSCCKSVALFVRTWADSVNFQGSEQAHQNQLAPKFLCCSNLYNANGGSPLRQLPLLYTQRIFDERKIPGVIVAVYPNIPAGRREAGREGWRWVEIFEDRIESRTVV